MKKAIAILAACMLVFGVAGMASAQDGEICSTCETDPGLIKVTQLCEDYGEQDFCTPEVFDYERFGSYFDGEARYSCGDDYCDSGAKGDIHRALVNVCECIPTVFDDVTTADTFDICMTIQVDKGNGYVTGDNGVYWFEEAYDGIRVETFDTQAAACEPDCGAYTDNERDFNDNNRFTASEYIYVTADGNTTNTLVPGSECGFDPAEQYVTIKTPNNDGDGFSPVSGDGSVWWVDIPRMIVDPAVAQEGWKVSVRVCITKDEGEEEGICGSCNCCCDIYVGELSCCTVAPTPDEGCSDALIYPYFPKTDGAYWYGLAITNLGDEAGTMSVTLYENDGDVGTISDVPVAANNMIVWGHTDVIANFGVTGDDGALGNSRGYFKVVTDFPATGFGMMAKDDGSSSMGYLPIELENCSNCDPCD